MAQQRQLKVHLDTDIGGDSDDLCALALLLASPEVELVGITTAADRDGNRTAYVRHALRLAGRTGVPVASGAFGFLGGFPHEPGLQDERYWPDLEPSPPGFAGEAIDLLCASAAAGATIVAIGPYTNLGVAVALRPGAFRGVPVVVMGGNVREPGQGLPRWGPAMDYNVQADRVAARIVFERLAPLVVPIEVTVRTWLRGTDLPTLRAAGQLPKLIARQAELQGNEWRFEALASANPGLPADLLNFHHDPLACAVAMGWECVTVAEIPLAVTERDGSLVLEEQPGAKPLRVVTDVDSEVFAARWLRTVTRL